MNKENVNNSSFIATPTNTSKETSLERIERIKLENQAKLDEKRKEIEQLLDANESESRRREELEDRITKLESANKALDRALYSERTKSEASAFQAETESDWISRKAVDILKQRCREGRYGVKCQN